jgi:hypothetical protein
MLPIYERKSCCGVQQVGVGASRRYNSSGENGREAQDPYSKNKTPYSGIEELVAEDSLLPLCQRLTDLEQVWASKICDELILLPFRSSPSGQTSGQTLSLSESYGDLALGCL